MITLSAKRLMIGEMICINIADTDVTVRLMREYDGAVLFNETFGGGSMRITCPPEWFTDAGDTGIDSVYILVTTEKNGEICDTARFALQTLPLILTTMDDELVFCDGDSVSLTVEAIYGQCAYRWQKSENGGSAWIDLSYGRTGSYAFAAAAAQSGWMYRCIAENDVGQSISGAVTVTVQKRPYIVTQPKKEYAALGGTGAFRIVAGGDDISYHWQESEPFGEWTNCNGIGATTPELSVSATEENDGKRYRCIIRNRVQEIVSEYNTLTVVRPPTILFHPENTTVARDGLAGFVAIIRGTNPVLQWQYRKNSQGDWTDIGACGALQNTLRFTATEDMDGYQFRCMAFNIAGTAYTNHATLHITQQFDLAAHADGYDDNILPKGNYVFSLNANRPGIVYSLGLGYNGNINWICENKSEDCAFHTDGKLPLRIGVRVSNDNIINGTTLRPMLTAGVSAEEWVSPAEAEHTLAKDFNFGWFSLGNRYGSRENTVSASLPCDVTVRYRPIWKDTL